MAIDFPTSPTVGQIIAGGNGLFYEWDGVAWNIVGNELNRMNFIDYVLTSGGTWNKPVGLRKLDLILVGAGGGSGGAAATGAGTSSGAGGGGGGGVVYASYSDMSILSSHSYTVGTGGSAGAAGANNGGVGGDTTFKLLTASGGGGGLGSTANSSVLSFAGGGGGAAASTEPASCLTQLLPGGRGEQGVLAAHGVASVATGGPGGNSQLSTRDGLNYLLGSNGYAGVVGRFPGGGGFGAANSVSQGARAGGAGAAGVIYMREWY